MKYSLAVLLLAPFCWAAENIPSGKTIWIEDAGGAVMREERCRECQRKGDCHECRSWLHGRRLSCEWEWKTRCAQPNRAEPSETARRARPYLR